ncbi:RNA 2',3'-cyclic phosphodiesterase [Candidatus Harpocratesius sp.]
MDDNQLKQSEQEKIRSFIAIDIPNQGTIQQILKYQARLQACIGPLKLVAPELMHITLKFLGNISIQDARCIYKILQEKINQSFFESNQHYQSNFKGVGDFRKQVFFVKIQGQEELLQKLHEIIDEELFQNQNILKETRPFHPHLTIARSRRRHQRSNSKFKTNSNPGQTSYTSLKHEYINFDFGKWTISKVVLKKSVLTPKGPIYSNLIFE